MSGTNVPSEARCPVCGGEAVQRGSPEAERREWREVLRKLLVPIAWLLAKLAADQWKHRMGL